MKEETIFLSQIYNYCHTISLVRAATLDNLFSPRRGTEIPYVLLQHNMQFSPMFPHVPLQILYFPYKYCIFVWKYTGLYNNWRTYSYTYYTEN
jgi:hypothetical protein